MACYITCDPSFQVASYTNAAVPLSPSDNFYGTPKPPAEPSPAAPPLNVSEALLPGARPSAQGKRKRNQSVSNMEQRASLEPPEEEEEESPVVNGNGVAITPGNIELRTSEREKHPFSVGFFLTTFSIYSQLKLHSNMVYFTNAMTMKTFYNNIFRQGEMCLEGLGCPVGYLLLSR